MPKIDDYCIRTSVHMQSRIKAWYGHLLGIYDELNPITKAVDVYIFVLYTTLEGSYLPGLVVRVLTDSHL